MHLLFKKKVHLLDGHNQSELCHFKIGIDREMIAGLMHLNTRHRVDRGAADKPGCQFRTGKEKVDTPAWYDSRAGKAGDIRIRSAETINITSLQEKINTATHVKGSYLIDDKTTNVVIYKNAHSLAQQFTPSFLPAGLLRRCRFRLRFTYRGAQKSTGL